MKSRKLPRTAAPVSYKTQPGGVSGSFRVFLLNAVVLKDACIKSPFYYFYKNFVRHRTIACIQDFSCITFHSFIGGVIINLSIIKMQTNRAC